MDNFEFIDALTGDKIIQDYTSGETYIEKNPSGADQIDSIFFPGCSMINYAMPLVQAVYNTLLDYKIVEGISLLCCGKILSYEPSGDVIRPAFEQQLRDHVSSLGIKRIVCACPNCVKALREAFALDERTADIELAVLPQILADLGFRLDKSVVGTLVLGDPGKEALLCPHDSCPDREYGDFADGLRAIMPEGMWKDPEHCRSKSVCCGSLPRAAGKVAAADKCADLNGREALEIGADAIVTPCMSCSFQLNMAQPHVQCVHFLELLYQWRVNWATVGYWMKLRFLFDETLGAIEVESSSDRNFAGLGSSSPTVSDIVASEIENEGISDDPDEKAAHGVDISNDDVTTIGL